MRDVNFWGTNTNGQLGNGSVGGIELPSLVPGLSTKIIDIAAGAAFSAALDEFGAVYVWGSNDHGQLGLGDLSDRSSPSNLVGGGIRKIVAGNDHILLMR